MKHLIHHARNEFKSHTFDYMLIATVGVFFLIALNLFAGERLIEFIILLSFVSFYVIWGIYHHMLTDKMHLRSLLEYILLGFTVLFLLKILIFPT